MTISTTNNQITVYGDGATTVFDFPFVADDASYIQVIYSDTSGNPTTLLSSQFSVTINPVATGQLWGVGGSITYPLTGSPVASGTSLNISRVLPLTQTDVISGQGDFSPTVVEQALDTLEMQMQQVASRTGQQRGTWVSDAVYNFGDVVQDGANGSNSGSYYMCAVANTADVWATDLAAGDWSLVIKSTAPVASLPLSIPNGGTGQITAAAALTALGGIGLAAINVYTDSNDFRTPGSLFADTRPPGDNSVYVATTGFVATSFAPINNPSFTGTANFQSLTSSTQVAALSFKPNSTSGVIGTTTNDSAAAGSVGEVITGSGSAVSLANGVAKTIASISLTPGDWDIFGGNTFSPAVSTTISTIVAGISAVNNTLPSDPDYAKIAATLTTGNSQVLAVPTVRVSVGSTTTYYLIALAAFGVSTMTATARMTARRRR